MAKGTMTKMKKGAKVVAGDALGAAAKAGAGVLLEAATKALGTGKKNVEKVTPKAKRAVKKAAKRKVAKKKTVKKKQTSSRRKKR